MAVSMDTRAQAVFDVLRADNPPLNEYEQVAILGAVALSPFRFINFFGVNIGPLDVFLLFAFASYVYRTRTYPFIPSRLTAIGVGLFLFAGAIGVALSPRRMAALLDYAQYVYIFLCAVPIAFVAFTDRRTRRMSVLILAIVLNILLLLSILIGIFTDTFVANTLGYGNENQLYWRVASVFAINLTMALDGQFPRQWRIASLVLAGFAAIPVVLSRSYTSLLLVIASLWLILAWYIGAERNRRMAYGRMFTIASAVAALVGMVFAVVFWDTIVQIRPIHRRLLQYGAAYQAGIEAFPLGAGLASGPVVIDGIPSGISRSVHNFVLAYFMQTGVLGVVGFTLVLVAWIRDVFISIFSEAFSSLQLDAFEFIPLAIFGTYFIIMLLQPVPVQRYWWIIFALSWASARSAVWEIDLPWNKSAERDFIYE